MAAVSDAPPLHVDDLGRLDYRAAWARQLALVDERKTGAGADRVLVVEHPHVFTLGRAQKAVANVLAPTLGRAQLDAALAADHRRLADKSAEGDEMIGSSVSNRQRSDPV